MKPDSNEVMTVQEVADALHLHSQTVKRLGDRGELPYFRVGGRGDRRIHAEDVRAYIDRNTIRRNDEPTL